MLSDMEKLWILKTIKDIFHEHEQRFHKGQLEQERLDYLDELYG